MDQKLPLLPVNLMVKNSLDNILVVFCVNGGWFWRDPAREENGIILMGSFQAMCMDLRMGLVFIW